MAVGDDVLVCNDFDHLRLPEGHRMRRCVLYAYYARIGRGNHGMTIYRGVCDRHSARGVIRQ